MIQNKALWEVRLKDYEAMGKWGIISITPTADLWELFKFKELTAWSEEQRKEGWKRTTHSYIFYESFHFPTDKRYKMCPEIKALDHLTDPKKRQPFHIKHHKLSIYQIKETRGWTQEYLQNSLLHLGNDSWAWSCPVSKSGHEHTHSIRHKPIPRAWGAIVPPGTSQGYNAVSLSTQILRQTKDLKG